MKKVISKKIFFILFLLNIIFFSSNVRAVSEFPNNIEITVGNLMSDNFRIYKKEYLGSDGNSGKVFCSSFWNDIYSTSGCTKTNYSADLLENEKAQAAIGAIINNGRQSDGTMTWNTYYYTELAINEFLYKEITANQVNNLNRYGTFPYEKAKIIQPAVNLGYRTFDAYKSERTIIENLKINGIPINNSTGDITEQLNDKNPKNYIVTADMKCYYDKYNKKTEKNDRIWISCSNPIVKLKVKINSDEYTNYTVTKSNNGNTINLSADISSYFKDNVGKKQDVSIELTAQSSKVYYLAQRYNCGSELQTMTPNLLKPSTLISNVTANGNFSIKPKETCGDKIALTSEDDYAIKNANLYKENEDYKNFGMLLDIENPSCSPTDSSELITCDYANGNTADVNSKKVITGRITNQGTSNIYDYLCTVSFSYDSDIIMKKNISSANKLIYRSDNGIIGRAKVDLDCNVPSLANSQNKSSMEFSLNQIAPQLIVKLDNTNNHIMDYKIENVSGVASKCTYSDKKIACENYDEKTLNSMLGYGWRFEADIVYFYPEDYNYSIDRSGDIHKTNDCSDCSKIGYGILVPENTEVSTDETSHLSEVKFKFSEDYYKIKENDNILNVTCPYTINKNEKNFKEILYHTIDSNKPFSDYKGNDRFTGSNWCSDSDVDSFDDYEEESETFDELAAIKEYKNENYLHIENDPKVAFRIEKKTGKCIYKGDMNLNGIWDNYDVSILQKTAVDKEYECKDGTIVKPTGLGSTDYENIFCDLANSNNDYIKVNGVDEPYVDLIDVLTVQNGIRTFENTIKGDLNNNGKIDLNDAVKIQNFLGEFEDFSEVEKKIADVNNDCIVSIADVTWIQRFVNGIIEPSSGIDTELPLVDNGYIKDEIINEKSNNRVNKCANNNDKVTSIIKNRPNANGDLKIKNEDGTVIKKRAKTPLYKFVLTPDNIKKIRANNKEIKGYSNFDSECNEGKKCVSNFISQATANSYVSDVSGLCIPGEYCDITNVIQENYIKGDA